MADGITIDETLGTITLSMTGATITSVNEEAAISLDGDAAEIVVSESSVQIVTDTSIVATVVRDEVAQIVTVAEQGPQGIPGGDGAAPTFGATNKHGSTIVAGNAVATHPSGVGVVLANATNDTRPAVGLSQASAADLATATIQTSGPFELADWTAITGATDLAPKATYYLSTTPGLLTTTSPMTSPAISHMVGRSVSPRILDLNIGRIIRL